MSGIQSAILIIHRTGLKELKEIKLIKLEEEVLFIMVDENFCSMNCMNRIGSMISEIEQIANHFGRLTEPKHLTEDNAWVKDYDYNWRNETNPKSNYRFVNKVTQEQRPITVEQYRDKNYTLNTN